MTAEDAIWTLQYVNPEDPTFSEAVAQAIAALRAQQEREKQQIWHKYPEEKPTVEKDYCVIRRFRMQGVEEVKAGEIWVEMDYWHNGPGDWKTWDRLGKNNPYWDTLYWVDLGRTETPFLLPDDLPGQVTRMFGEVVSQED